MGSRGRITQHMRDDFQLNMSEIERIIKCTFPEGLTGKQKKQKFEFEKQHVKYAMCEDHDLRFVLALFHDRRWSWGDIKPHETCSVALAKGINQYFLENAKFSSHSYFGHVVTAFDELADVYDFALPQTMAYTDLDEKKPESSIITRSVMTVFQEHYREMDDCVRQYGPYEGAADARDLENSFQVTGMNLCQQIGQHHLWGNFKGYAKDFGVPVEKLTTMCQPLIAAYTRDQDRQNEERKQADRWAANRRIWANYP